MTFSLTMRLGAGAAFLGLIGVLVSPSASTAQGFRPAMPRGRHNRDLFVHRRSLSPKAIKGLRAKVVSGVDKADLVVVKVDRAASVEGREVSEAVSSGKVDLVEVRAALAGVRAALVAVSLAKVASVAVNSDKAVDLAAVSSGKVVVLVAVELVVLAVASVAVQAAVDLAEAVSTIHLALILLVRS